MGQRLDKGQIKTWTKAVQHWAVLNYFPIGSVCVYVCMRERERKREFSFPTLPYSTDLAQRKSAAT